MKLCLDNAKALNYSPRRLSYTEKDKLEKLLDEYLKSEIIRPSESEFSKRKQVKLDYALIIGNLTKHC